MWAECLGLTDTLGKVDIDEALWATIKKQGVVLDEMLETRPAKTEGIRGIRLKASSIHRWCRREIFWVPPWSKFPIVTGKSRERERVPAGAGIGAANVLRWNYSRAQESGGDRRPPLVQEGDILYHHRQISTMTTARSRGGEGVWSKAATVKYQAVAFSTGAAANVHRCKYSCRHARHV